jgi:hypothetical protein
MIETIVLRATRQVRARFRREKRIFEATVEQERVRCGDRLGGELIRRGNQSGA